MFFKIILIRFNFTFTLGRFWCQIWQIFMIDIAKWSLDLKRGGGGQTLNVCFVCSFKVLPSKLDWFPSTTEAFWGKKWALMDFQCALESYVKVRNCSSLAIY